MTAVQQSMTKPTGLVVRFCNRVVDVPFQGKRPQWRDSGLYLTDTDLRRLAWVMHDIGLVSDRKEVYELSDSWIEREAAV